MRTAPPPSTSTRRTASPTMRRSWPATAPATNAATSRCATWAERFQPNGTFGGSEIAATKSLNEKRPGISAGALRFGLYARSVMLAVVDDRQRLELVVGRRAAEGP